MEGTSNSSAGGNNHTVVINALTSRGWCFGDVDYLNSLVTEISSFIGGGNQLGAVAESVEAELLNMDIKLIGGKSLPDPTELRRCSHLQGPKVLQISSARDITRSSAEEFLGSSSGKRVLKLVLTDGKTEISALEYSHIPPISNDVTPGTKVRLENKAVIRDGLVCLTPKEVTVLGGYVQSLAEEWQMKKKYASLSRSSGRQSQDSKGGDGPPPFEELQIRTGSHHRDYHKTTSRNNVPTAAESSIKRTGGEKGESSEIDGNKKGTDKNLQRNVADSDPKISAKDENQEKPSSSDTRPKQVVEAVPLQNQAAAQILLEKMKHSSSNDRQYQGRRGRGRGRGRGREEEDSAVFTLDEWEKRNTGGGVRVAADPPSDTTRDEDLAWQLQNQFDLEDSHGQEAHGTGAADIRMNMFDYGRPDDSFGHGRGRGRGGGRGRGRGRGQRRGRGRG